MLDSETGANVLNAKPTRDMESRKAVRPARIITDRKREAARIDRSAVTGPCTAEYGPCNAGKRKTPSTDRTATNANPQASRPGVIGIFDYTWSLPGSIRPRWLRPG